jgi:hypothetical protein
LRSHSWAASVVFRFMPQNADVYVRGFVRQFVHYQQRNAGSGAVVRA